MKALITGITGFAGSFLAEHLLAEGDEVLGTSSRCEWKEWAGDELRRLELLPWDIGDPSGPGPDVRRRVSVFAPDCIYHLAALSVPEDCGLSEPSRRAWAVNVDGTRRVLELAADLPRRPRIVFTGSSHVYAKPTNREQRWDEAAAVQPARAYGKTKLAAEERIHALRADLRLDVVIARSFQHAGPRQEPRLMLSEWASKLARRSAEPLEVVNLSTWVDLTDVRDVVRAYRLLAERGTSGATYNVGSGVPQLTGRILESLLRLAASSPAVQEKSPGERFDPIADNRRLVACTGWQPRISLEQTLRDTLDFWQGRDRLISRTPSGAAD